MDNPLSIIPPKVRAYIYAAVVLVNAALAPLVASGVVPAQYGALTAALVSVFGGTLALSHVPPTAPEVAAAAPVVEPVAPVPPTV